jgi:hypothetical protein
MQTGDSIFKRKCCGRTSEGRPKRTRKTTKGDGWRNGTGDSQRRIRGADTDPLIEDDGGSDRYESDRVTVTQKTTMKSTATGARCSLGEICEDSMTKLS